MKPTSIYIHPKIKEDMQRDMEVFGSQTRVFNAALWLFLNAPDEQKVRAVREVAKLKQSDPDADAIESDATTARGKRGPRGEARR